MKMTDPERFWYDPKDSMNKIQGGELKSYEVELCDDDPSGSNELSD